VRGFNENRKERTRLREEEQLAQRLRNHPSVPDDFDWQMYLDLNPHLRKKGLNTESLVLRHYIKAGKRSNLPYKRDGIANTRPDVVRHKAVNTPPKNPYLKDLPGAPTPGLRNASKYDRWAPHADTKIDYQKTFDIILDKLRKGSGFTYARICDGEYKILFWKSTTWNKVDMKSIERCAADLSYLIQEKQDEINNNVLESPLLLGMQSGTIYDKEFEKELKNYRAIINTGISSVFPSWAYVTDNLPKLFRAFNESGKPIVVVGPSYLSIINEFKIDHHIETSLDYSWLEQDQIEKDVFNVVEHIVENEKQMPIILFACSISGKMVMANLYKKYKDQIIQLDMGSNLDPFANVISRGWHNYERQDMPASNPVNVWFTASGDRTGARIHEDLFVWAWCHMTHNNFCVIKDTYDIIDQNEKLSRIDLHKEMINMFGIPVTVQKDFTPSSTPGHSWHEVTVEHLDYRDRVEELFTPEFRKKALDKYYQNPRNAMTKPKDRLFVSVHIRRGDVNMNNEIRYVPNSYFVGIIKKIQEVEPDAIINIFSDTSYQNTSGVQRGGENESLDVFEKMGCKLYVNYDLKETWKMMIESDILVSSKSSFSWVPAFYNKNLVIHYESWIQKLEHWLSNNDPELFDKIEDYIKNRKRRIIAKIDKDTKKALVLGGGGFVGGHLAKRLKEEGYWVRIVDIKPKHEYWNNQDICDEYVQGDLRNLTLVNKVMLSPVQKGKENPFDEVYQLAADMGGAGYIFTGENDANVMHNSALINLNVAQEAVNRSVKRVFYSSSACMYPEHNQLDPANPNCEESSAYPANPDSEYGWEKLFSERLYLAFNRNHGLDVRIGRFHNIFGPMGTWQGGKEKSPAAMCRKAAEANDGESIEVWGEGTQTRSFLYIDECLEAILRFMRQDNFIGPVNIGSEEKVTINELADMAIKISQKNVKIENLYGEEFEKKYGYKCPLGVKGRNSDNRLYKEKMGWEPSQPLFEGMKTTYEWISKTISDKKNKN
jgi:nucleoside-diphosphate-sugar epimerase